MTEQAAEKVEDDRIGSVRGPAYPAVSLPRAMELVEAVQRANVARTTVSPDVFYKIWGYKGESGATRPLMAALNHYQLMEYVGRGDTKQVRLSSLAHRIIYDKVPNSAEKAAALKESALAPVIFKKLFDELKVPVPPEFVVETFLTRDCKYSEQAAKAIYESYLATLVCAGLDKPNDMPSDLDSKTGNEGAAVDQARIEGIPASGGIARVPAPPPEPAVAKMGSRKEVFALDEGDVTLIFPDNLSPDSYSDLESYLELFLRKAKRRAEQQRFEKAQRSIPKSLGGEGSENEGAN